MKYTNREIANDRDLWDEYYNTSALCPFESLTFEERLADLNRDYPDSDSISAAAATLGRKGGASKSPAKTAAVRENGRKGGRPTGRPSPRGFGEGHINTPKGYYCQDCGKWVPWSKESRYSTGAEIRTVCVGCYDAHKNE